MAEIVMWQYRWLNPANDPNQPPSMLDWKEVRPWSRIQTMEQRIEELRDFRYDGKPAYEVRALGVIPAGVPACVGIDVALALPGVERLREWAAIGPVQRAAVEAFAAGVAPRDEAEKLDALRQTLEIIAVGDSHHPKADADAALRATGFWRAATHGVALPDGGQQ